MSDAMPERWLPIPGYEGLYEVSDLGRVRSLVRMTSFGSRGGRVLKTHYGSHGYPVVSLWANRSGTPRTVHSLVAEAFLGPRPAGMEVRHRDGTRTNAALSNLEYGTHSENERDKRIHGTNRNAAKTHCDHGHEFTPENTFQRTDGGRGCRACRARVCHNYYIRKTRQKGEVGA